jgi:hypothetical protein
MTLKIVVQRFKAMRPLKSSLNINASHGRRYHKRLRYFLDICHKHGFSLTDRPSIPAFQEKLRAKASA